MWRFFCLNEEYLFHRFCETRNIREMLAFHTEERRDALLSYVIDLYADDLDSFPNAVSLERAHLDRSDHHIDIFLMSLIACQPQLIILRP